MQILSSYLIVIIPLIVLLLVRIFKFVIFYFAHNRDLQYTIDHAMNYGHMPSVHSALMASLVTSVGYFSGLNSGAFAVSLILAILIVDDATRLRVYMGEHGRYINMLVDKLNANEAEYPRLKERMGHKPLEALAGAIIGFILTAILIVILK